MELQKWKEKNAKGKQYAHFDEKVSLKKVWDYISNPKNIEEHGFYPFIHYKKKLTKFRKVNGKGAIKEKWRELCYAAHIDRYIYSYYGYLLNQEYNVYLEDRDMNMVAVAYRDNLKQSNINFAKRAFDKIKDVEECYVIIGDFTDFFDSLDHIYLKKCMCDVLRCKSLPADYYAVFKNITKYSVWELTDLLELNNLEDKEKDIEKLNHKRKILTTEQFKQHKSQYIRKNKEYGIPQGSSISAVLANVYMINADEQMNRLASEYNGLYMRYSDDFIVVLPNLSEEMFGKTYNSVLSIINSIPNLKLQPEKTQIYEYSRGVLNSCNSKFITGAKDTKNEIDYLGFTFNGKEITVRDKTISKYYYRMYRKLKTIERNKGYTRKHKRISCKNLYKNYTEKGAHIKDAHGKKRGNFITYIDRAQKKFENEPIDRKTRKHMLKIRRRIDKVFK